MKLNILAKLMIGFMSLVALMAALGIFSLSQLSSISEKTQFIGTSDLPAVRVIGEIEAATGMYRQKQLQHVIADNQIAKTEYENAIKEYDTKIKDLFREYEPLIANDEDRVLLNKTHAEWDKYIQQSSPFLDLSRKLDSKGAIGVLNGEALTTYTGSLTDTLTQWDDFNENFAKQDVQAANQIYQNTRLLTIGLLVVLALIALVAGFLLARSISSAAQQMATVAEGIAAGELDHQITIKSKDEMGDMAASFSRMITYLQGMAGVAQKLSVGDLTENVNPISEKDVLGNAFKEMVDNLRNSVSQVAESASSLGAASEQLASAANQAGQATSQISTTIQQAAKGTAQQSESVNRTATSIEQMSRSIDGVTKGAQDQTLAVTKAAQITSQIASAIQQVSVNARAGAKGSEKAAEVAEGGAQTVSATLQGMESI